MPVVVAVEAIIREYKAAEMVADRILLAKQAALPAGRPVPVQPRRRAAAVDQAELLTAAVAAGAVPLLPDRLSYPELLTPRLAEEMLYDGTDADLAALDEYEAVDEGMYRRQTVDVALEDGQTISVWTYYAIPDADGPTPPSRRYLDVILAGATHHGLPPHYIQQLAATPTID